ncbi:MAG TPA: DNA helicase RecQ [Acidiferrobacteraceae bacterium]|nr:DNA helicase RecQ [Acidiferrobacteraceae bacterium]
MTGHPSTDLAERLAQAYRILKNTFGYTEFRPQQRHAIAALLEGRDVLTLMPTGGGKSLCYQIPALVRPGCAVVISPLIALMQDQVDALQQLGIRAAFLNSTQEPAEQRQVERALRDGVLDLLYVAPERLLTERMLGLLDHAPLALFAIDEAHCVAQWGHDFRKDYRALSVLHERFPAVPRIALTATAEPRTRIEIIEQLALEGAAVFIDSFDRPNIHYTIAEEGQGRTQLWDFLERTHPRDAGIVYCLSRKKVEEITAWLQAQGRAALPYHAGLSDTTRRQNQQRFLREDALIMVATVAFGMGIDKPDVRFVAHLSLPKSIEAYYQETGRAGRDGAAASAWMAYGLHDVITLRQFVQQTDAPDLFKRIAHQKLDAMLGLCELTTCRRQALLAYFGETRTSPCGYCDNCQEPPPTWDATVAGRQALSCVYRTGQRFGAQYAIDILMGKANTRMRSHGHDQLALYGAGAEYSGPQWRSVFRQLVTRGYLELDPDGHGALRLTPFCRPLLRGEQTLTLRALRVPGKRPRAADAPVRRGDALFEALRALRLQLARAQGVPPYVIFHDTTLEEMARRRPTNLTELRDIAGVGEVKLERYGAAFITALRAYRDSS